MINWTDVKANWVEYSKKAHSNWSKLTQEQINNVGGNRQELSRLIQFAYQCDQKVAENQIELWLSNLLGSSHLAEVKQSGVEQPGVKQGFDQLFNSHLHHEATLDDKLKDHQDSAETIVERDEIVGSPYHKGY